jgi:hypothetical protein
MKILCILILLLFTGCDNFGEVKAHKTFTKLSDAQVLNFEQLVDYFDSNLTYEEFCGVLHTHTDIKSEICQEQKYIVIPFKHKGIAGGGSRYAFGFLDLCKNGIPSLQDLQTKLEQNAIIFPPLSMQKVAVITSPQILKQQNFLDENNKTKGDICVYPPGNIVSNTMKPEDYLTITKEEMDKALEEFENL